MNQENFASNFFSFIPKSYLHCLRIFFSIIIILILDTIFMNLRLLMHNYTLIIMICLRVAFWFLFCFCFFVLFYSWAFIYVERWRKLCFFLFYQAIRNSISVRKRSRTEIEFVVNGAEHLSNSVLNWSVRVSVYRIFRTKEIYSKFFASL